MTSATEVTRWHRLAEPLTLAVGMGVASAALRLRDPHRTHSWGVCPFYALTGLYCPGCGGLRAVNDLTHGRLAAAASSNLVVTAAYPCVAFIIVWLLVQRWRGRPTSVRIPAWVGYALGVVALVFTICRNTPAGAWLAPS